MPSTDLVPFREPSEAGDACARHEGVGGRTRTTTRADLIERMGAIRPDLAPSDARIILEAALEEISDTLIRGEPVKLRSFGLFTVRAKRERVGRNPRTGVEAAITPRRVLTFRPSPVLVERLGRSSED